MCLQMNPKRKRPQKEREEKVESVKDFFFCNQSAKKKRQRVDRRCAQKSQSNKFTFLLFYVSEEFVFFLRAQRSTIVSHLFFSSFSFTRGAPRKNEENRKKTTPFHVLRFPNRRWSNETRQETKKKTKEERICTWSGCDCFPLRRRRSLVPSVLFSSVCLLFLSSEFDSDPMPHKISTAIGCSCTVRLWSQLALKRSQ